jgi:NAD(P)H-dependent FMN reductase
MSATLAPRIASQVGNPRPQSRTHGLARTLAEQIARVLGATGVADVDLAPFGPRVLDPADAAVTAASAWADAHAPALLAASRAQPQALATT